MKKLAKNIDRERLECEKQLRQFKRQTFACIPDAQKAAQKLFKKFKYHQLQEIEIETVTEKQKLGYQVKGVVSLCPQKVQPLEEQAGRFVLATNVLEPETLTSEEMLLKYKGQQTVERGFRFLKDPMFLTDSVFLKSPKRIEA